MRRCRPEFEGKVLQLEMSQPNPGHSRVVESRDSISRADLVFWSTGVLVQLKVKT